MNISDLALGRPDAAGNSVAFIYTKNPPDHAIYRTAQRVMIAFADDPARAKLQGIALAPLSALRDEIAGMLAGREDSPGQASQVDSYNQRVAGALGEALQGFYDNAMATLLRVKNDLADERQSLAKFQYVTVAGACATLLIVVSWLLLTRTVAGFLFPTLASPNIVWAAIGGGTLGAVFSVATGISARTLMLETRYRDNATDAGLRILVGAIGASVVVSLQRAGVITGSLLGSPPGQAVTGDTIYFILGFLAGFSERLVPDLLAKINIDTTPPPEAPGADVKVAAVVAAAHLKEPAGSYAGAIPSDLELALTGPAGAAVMADPAADEAAASEDCLCDGLPAGTAAPTGDAELPQAAGGVAARP